MAYLYIILINRYPSRNYFVKYISWYGVGRLSSRQTSNVIGLFTSRPHYCDGGVRVTVYAALHRMILFLAVFPEPNLTRWHVRRFPGRYPFSYRLLNSIYYYSGSWKRDMSFRLTSQNLDGLSSLLSSRCYFYSDRQESPDFTT